MTHCRYRFSSVPNGRVGRSASLGARRGESTTWGMHVEAAMLIRVPVCPCLDFLCATASRFETLHHMSCTVKVTQCDSNTLGTNKNQADSAHENNQSHLTRQRDAATLHCTGTWHHMHLHHTAEEAIAPTNTQTAQQAGGPIWGGATGSAPSVCYALSSFVALFRARGVATPARSTDFIVSLSLSDGSKSNCFSFDSRALAAATWRGYRDLWARKWSWHDMSQAAHTW